MPTSTTRIYEIYSVDAVVVFDSSVASTSCHYTVALGSSENGQSMYPWGSSGTYHKSRVARTIGRSFARRKGKSGWKHSSSASQGETPKFESSAYVGNERTAECNEIAVLIRIRKRRLPGVAARGDVWARLPDVAQEIVVLSRAVWSLDCGKREK